MYEDGATKMEITKMMIHEAVPFRLSYGRWRF